jgi:hypothetical protein
MPDNADSTACTRGFGCCRRSGLGAISLVIACSAAGFVLGRSMDGPHVVVVNGEGKAMDQSPPGVLAWLFGHRKNAPTETPSPAAHTDPRDDPRSDAVHAAEAALIKRSYATDLKLSGYVESSVNEPTWSRLQKTSLAAPIAAGQTLRQICDQFANEAKVDLFRIDWAKLRESGLEPQWTVVNANISGCTIENAIGRALDGVVSSKGDQAPLEPLAFDVQNGSVWITTKSEVLKRQSSAVYDVWDLLVREPIEGQRLSEPYQGYDDSWLWNAGELRDQLKQLIYDQVPGNWEERGQGNDRIAEFDGRLIVTASPYSHRDLMRLLAQLRAARRVSHAVTP